MCPHFAYFLSHIGQVLRNYNYEGGPILSYYGGCVKTKNPFNPSQIRTISLKSEDVSCIN